MKNPRQSSAVTDARAASIASHSASNVLAAADHICCLTLLHRFSIGLKSGEYGGRYSSVAPVVSIVPRTQAA